MEIIVMKFRKVLPHLARRLMALSLLLSLSSWVQADERILVAMDKGAAFTEVYKGIKDDLDGEIPLSQWIIDKKAKPAQFGQQISKYKPSLIVLIGNQATTLYAKYQAGAKKSEYPPSLIIAALFADKLVKKVKNSTAIRYEIPAVTSMRNARLVFNRRFKTIGVIYRKWMNDIVDNNERFLKTEGFRLERVVLGSKNKDVAGAVKSGIDQLAKKGVDAIWIVTDNKLLNGKILQKAWIPGLAKHKMITVVNVEQLAQSKLQFGNFAVYPDLYGLGIQGANAIFEIQEEDWSVEDRDIEEPLSVKKTLNKSMTKKRGLSVRKKGLNTLDKVIE